MEFDFVDAALPNEIQPYIISNLHNMQGTWKEIEKPKDKLMSFLARLGVGGIKRRIVVNAESLYEVRRLWPPITDFTKGVVVENKSPKPDGETSTEATTEPSSPLRESDVQARWYQKQHFPLGRFVEGEILVGDPTPVEQVDPETGIWLCVAKCEGDIMYQRRFSSQHNVTLFETRALVNRKLDIASNGSITFCDEKNYDDESLMLFQWVMIDHDKDDEKSLCYYYLERVHPNES